MSGYDLHEKAADIVRDAGGELVGRTRLQKVAYLCQLAGFTSDFSFEYRQFGPYSQELSEAIEIAEGLKLVEEEERQTNWGGWYSIFRLGKRATDHPHSDEYRARFIEAAKKISAIELELAATAAFLFVEEGVGKDGHGDPWKETRVRKPTKADEGRLNKAKIAYRKLMKIETPESLPAIA